MKEGWTYKKLGEVCSKGRNIKWDIVADTTTYKYIDLTSVDRGDLRIHNPQTISKSDAPSRAKQIVELGDIIFATTRPTLRRVSLIDEGFDGDICSTGFCVLRPQKDKITSKWIFYVLLYDGFYNYIEPLQTGASYPAVTDNIVKDYTLPVPSLSEQQRIVSRLDSAFAHIDERKANAEKQLSEARALFQKSLAKAMEPKEGWEERNLGDVAEVNRGRSKHRPRNDKRLFGGPYPFIQTGDIRNAQGGEIKDFSQTYSEFGLSQSKLWAKGTICITIAANIGETAILGFDACFPDSIVGIHPDETVLDALFLNYYLLSIKKEIDSQSYGTAQKNINLEVLNNIVMQIPPLAEQQRIVERLDALSENIRKYEEIQRQIISECDALKQALLRKVFE